jgi:hypothetical protein
MNEKEINTNYAIYNPHNKPIEELPVIYGFNNGGSPGWYSGELLAEDGHFLGSHICTNEGYMLGDLGIYEGHRPDRHEDFKKHYPDGYRMDFISLNEVKTDSGLMKAYEKNQEMGIDRNKNNE